MYARHVGVLLRGCLLDPGRLQIYGRLPSEDAITPITLAHATVPLSRIVHTVLPNRHCIILARAE